MTIDGSTALALAALLPALTEPESVAVSPPALSPELHAAASTAATTAKLIRLQCFSTISTPALVVCLTSSRMVVLARTVHHRRAHSCALRGSCRERFAKSLCFPAYASARATVRAQPFDERPLDDLSREYVLPAVSVWNTVRDRTHGRRRARSRRPRRCCPGASKR